MCADAVPEALALGTHTVVLHREEYETLVQISLQYESLKQNLIQGGVSYEAIVLLSNSSPSVPPADTTTTTPETEYVEGFHEKGTISSESSDESGVHGLYRGSEDNVWDNADSLSEDEDFLPDVQSWSQEPQAYVKSSPEDTPEQPDRVARRTLLLSNLAEGTRHADITAAVRGGRLVDVFVWHRDRKATVSFCVGSDAADFYRFVCKNDLYIKQKRVEVSWNLRQYHLSGIVAWRVKNGGTRNLVIRAYRHEKSEKAIRDDLDHIHNLVVIKVEFNNGDCYISTNSISAASFAKTCMMSRLKYKGSRIDFAADECAQPLESIPCPIASRPDGAKDFQANANVNRFALLDVAGF
ncbi:uncharacterized protein F5Z01DRAFT_673149 [Emericellopsis atlantica]|uniref:RRM domain-containing protein n=1 Tax=Emericellopsis atlantica TaxID=2614577 RepID=A0A9P8CQ29_9HYPO|nr:uncharacterized protein F5Z01DRAFT_673149 [Emericellopsis atlantica]KAG9255193.1 hypothetical protein F5Z01DRAFT_673149 [Emericellopsis atlantica]